MRARTLVIGDVHGCLEELDELLQASDFVKDRDQLVFVGDLLDRGPFPVESLRRARELGATVVQGNHEEKHLRWYEHERRRLTALILPTREVVQVPARRRYVESIVTES